MLNAVMWLVELHYRWILQGNYILCGSFNYQRDRDRDKSSIHRGVICLSVEPPTRIVHAVLFPIHTLPNTPLRSMQHSCITVVVQDSRFAESPASISCQSCTRANIHRHSSLAIRTTYQQDETSAGSSKT